MTLEDRNNEKGYEFSDDSWVKIAFKEILYRIYHTRMQEQDWDKIIDLIGVLIMKKTNLTEETLNWQKVEELLNTESYELLYHFNFDEIIKIISKSKVSKDYDWEDIDSKDFPLDKVNHKIITSIQTDLEFKTAQELEDEYIEKGDNH